MNRRAVAWTRQCHQLCLRRAALLQLRHRPRQLARRSSSTTWRFDGWYAASAGGVPIRSRTSDRRAPRRLPLYESTGHCHRDFEKTLLTPSNLRLCVV